MQQLPPPTGTTDVYLAAVLERLDALLLALPAPQPQATPRRRATKTPSKGDQA